MDPSLTGLGDLLLGSLIGVLGVLALLLSLLRPRRADPLLAAFGVFSLLYGLRQFLGSELTSSLGISAATTVWVTTIITYVINVPAWLFFWLLFEQKLRSLIFVWLCVVSTFAVVGVVSDLVRQTPGTLARHPNNVLVLIGLIVAVTALWPYVGRMTSDLRILLVGFSVFGLFAANNNLVSIGLVPWSWREESFGFIFFVGCLGTIAVRRFFLRERQLAVIEGEIDTARQIQSSLLPDGPPDTPGISVAVRFQPTSGVAGDLYDFLTFDRETFGVLVADVSGHGVPAALVGSLVKATTHSHLSHAHRPAEFLASVNETLCALVRRGFVTAVYIHIDSRRREILAASAGHPPPLLLHSGSQEIREIGGQGPILGRFESAKYEERSYSVSPGDRLVLYTDGLTEAQNSEQEMLGEERLRSFLLEDRSRSAEELCDHLIARLQSWTGNRRSLALEDDLTLLAVDFLHQ